MKESLPILEIIPELKKTFRDNMNIVLQAPPGAGKSTQLPLEILNEPWLNGKKILMLEPRRLAAKSVAERMAELLNEKVGQTVGYRIRFESKVSENTRIEVLTEGILTKIIQHDNALEGIGLVIFDEFHERSLHSDLALSFCREIQQVLREDLRLLLMSATIQSEKISEVLNGAPVITSGGRQYPLDIRYEAPDANSSLINEVGKTIRKVLALHEGDVLVFLPGYGEIHKTIEFLEKQPLNAKLYPLFGDLPFDKQQEAIKPDSEGKRKIVLATSIAETSITIEGIKVVIDSGYSRVPKFDVKTGLTKLETAKVTLDSADQRAGRAGRLGPGICYRLWSEGSHQYLLKERTPEILESELSPLVLEVFNWGIGDISQMNWITPPPLSSVSKAHELLSELGAVKDKRITQRGKEILRLPTHPRLASLLLYGKEENALSLAVDIAALLEERDPLSGEAKADLTLRVEALRRWRNKERVNADLSILARIERSAKNWRSILKAEEENSAPNPYLIGKLVSYAYPERIGRRRREISGSIRVANGRIAKLFEFDPLAEEEWISIAQMDLGSNEGKIFLAAPLNYDDVSFRAEKRETLRWNKQKGILMNQVETRIGEIIVSSTENGKVSDEEKSKVLCEVVKTEGLTLFDLNEEVVRLQAKVSSLRRWRQDEEWPDLSSIGLEQTVADWLPPYLSQVRRREDFRKLNFKDILLGLIPWDLQQKVEFLAPEKIKVPSGSMIGISYKSDGSSPILAVRIQELFGLLETPLINEGKTRLLIHLLSPASRPVQVTQDLKSFWQNTYPEVRKELKIRYPRHYWPDDPWTAEAVRGVKKRQ